MAIESLDKMMENKTVIAIAHRLSTIAAMDRLIVLDKGANCRARDACRGLLEQNGLYAPLWKHQSGGFLVSMPSKNTGKMTALCKGVNFERV